MRGFIDQLLAEFVDREAELEALRRILEDDAKSLLFFWGRSGVGKSCLMMRLAHEMATRQLRYASIVCNSSTNHSYLTVMRRIRDGLGAQSFQAFTDLVNYFTKPNYNLTVTLEGSGSIAVLPKGRFPMRRSMTLQVS